jgi:hypothetical protein
MLPLALALAHLTLASGSDFEWRPHNTALEVGAAATLALDWSQTLALRSTWEESNPILGPHPSTARVNVYFASAILIHAVAARFLPFPFREIFQGGTIMFEGAIVRSNRGLGIGFAVPW